MRASANRAARESEQKRRQEVRAATRLSKKAAAHAEKKALLLVALEQEYASGKISQECFHELKTRENDIGLELLVFGKAAGVALGKRYLCGKMEKDEFERIQKEILPAGYFTEREAIKSDFNERKNRIDEFKKEHEGEAIHSESRKNKIFAL